MKTKHIIASAVLSAGITYILSKLFNKQKPITNCEEKNEILIHRLKKNRHNGSLAKHLQHHLANAMG